MIAQEKKPDKGVVCTTNDFQKSALKTKDLQNKID